MPKLLRIALLLLLLSMQGISAAHEIDKGEAHDGSLCVTCSLGSGHDGLPTSAAEYLLTASDGSQAVSTSITAPAAAPRHIPEARAPPCSL